MSIKNDGEGSESTTEGENVHLPVVLQRTGSCSSLSNRSTITYQIGVFREADITNATLQLADIYFRITANTGKGMFSNDWVSLSKVSEAFDDLPSGQGLTSSSLHAIYFGKSLNTSGFLLAALREEGLVVSLAGRRPSYQRTDFSSFVMALLKVADPDASSDLGTPIEKARKKRGNQN